MPGVSTSTTYTLKLSEKEYKLITKSLALLAGVGGPRAMPDDRTAAQELNARLLDVMAADLREKLAVAEGKRRQKTTDEDAPYTHSPHAKS